MEGRCLDCNSPELACTGDKLCIAGVAPKVTLDLGYRFKSAFGLPVVEASSFDPYLTNVDNSSHLNLGVHVFQVGVNIALN